MMLTDAREIRNAMPARILEGWLLEFGYTRGSSSFWRLVVAIHERGVGRVRRELRNYAGRPCRT